MGTLEQRREFRDRHREQRNAESRRRSQREKQEAINHYGGKCLCCGEKELVFLGIDHIDGGGRAHREQLGGGNRIYRWLKQNGYPSGFQTLCHNCNFAKDQPGGCPHQHVKLDTEHPEPLGSGC